MKKLGTSKGGGKGYEIFVGCVVVWNLKVVGGGEIFPGSLLSILIRDGAHGVLRQVEHEKRN